MVVMVTTCCGCDGNQHDDMQWHSPYIKLSDDEAMTQS